MGSLFLMAGVPGCGKSTFLEKNVHKDSSVIISRDKIRFSLIKPEDNYFTHEDKVVKIFWNKINEELQNGKDVFVDQTSLTPKARKWLLSHVKGYDKAYLIWVDTPLETCLNRNENRKGTLGYVPRGQIRRMYLQFIAPTLDEGFETIFRYDGEENTLFYYLTKAGDKNDLF